MKGVVFTELVEMVEDVYSPEVADRIITTVDPPSGGAYTSVGTYPFEELQALLGALAAETGHGVPALLTAFGERLFDRFRVKFPEIFVEAADGFDFLEKVEGIIHVEVRKLYSDAQLPTFEIERVDPDTLVMIYASQRALSHFGEGLMRGCLAHFGEEAQVEREDLSGGQGTRVRFTLRRRPRS